jgi:hypothetical protein
VGYSFFLLKIIEMSDGRCEVLNFWRENILKNQGRRLLSLPAGKGRYFWVKNLTFSAYNSRKSSLKIALPINCS